REPGGTHFVIEGLFEHFLALDVRGLTLDSMNLIGTLAESLGASEDDLHDLRFRWEMGLDPATPITQLRLPFKKNSSENRAAHRSVERAEELRRDAGWAKIAGLP